MIIAKGEQKEIQRLQKALDEHAAQLQATNSELEKFTYSVSHDLRAPLRAIEGFSKILLEDYDDKLDDEGKRFLKIIDESSRKMTRLLDDLLILSRFGRQTINLEVVDMKESVDAAWEDLEPLPDRKIELKIDTLPEAWGDAALIQQIWTQLLANAVKFTGPKEKALIEVSGKTEGDRNVYCVKDNGVGFNMKSAGKLFGVFQRMHTEDEFPGSGIGLAIVQRIARRISGEVWTKATLDEGAAFYFALPLPSGKA